MFYLRSVRDKEIIVLGGLLEDNEEISLSKIPLLGDIPVLGKAFQSKGKSRVKTNLMVFLRPTIIRNASDARPLTQIGLDRIRLQDRLQTDRDVSKLDEFLDISQANRRSNQDLLDDQ